MTDMHETAAQLDAMLQKIKSFPDPRRATVEWKQAYNLLKKTPAAGNHLDNVILQRDVEELARMIRGLRAAGLGEPLPGATEAVIDEATLKAALKAFKRRLKIQRLDDQSRIDPRDPTSKGETSEIAAIEPPRDWSAEVWDELVRRGALRRAGRGVYEFLHDLA